jgi:hypothetical protein
LTLQLNIGGCGFAAACAAAGAGANAKSRAGVMAAAVMARFGLDDFINAFDKDWMRFV